MSASSSKAAKNTSSDDNETKPSQPEVELEPAKLPEDEFEQPKDEDETGKPAEGEQKVPSVVVASTSVEPSPWQAIYSPQHGAYYFHNGVTGETTWVNPLAPTEPPASETDPATKPEEEELEAEKDKNAVAGPGPNTRTAIYEAALAAGIDPALAYLDPSLLPSSSGASAYKARFNARTGAFTAMDARSPDHLSEFERAKRMSEVRKSQSSHKSLKY